MAWKNVSELFPIKQISMACNKRSIANTNDNELVEIGSGDSVDLQTPNSDQFHYFKITRKFFRFSVKAANDVYICLAYGPSQEPPMYKIRLGIDGNTRSTIHKNDEKEVDSVATPALLSGSDFRGFWISWADEVLEVGREKEPKPFLSYDDDELIPIKYLGFCTTQGATGEWTLGGSPLVALGTRAEWVKAKKGVIPQNAFVGGHEGNRPVYIIRVDCQKGVIPGKIVEGDHVCYFGGLDGIQYYREQYEVLCNWGGKWVPASNGDVPPNALAGGTSFDGEVLYIGRAIHKDLLMTGYVRKSHRCCYIPYLHREHRYTIYEVLTW